MDALPSERGAGNHCGKSRLSSVFAIRATSRQFVCSQSLARCFAPPKNQVSFRLFVKTETMRIFFERLVARLGVSEVLR
jgi:hypothetical protein